MSFGIQTVLGWDLGAVQAVGADLVKHEYDLRQCFTDFRGSSDLAHAWSGSAADAQHKAAATLAQDLYTLSDMVGLIGVQVNRKAADLVEYQNAIRKARTLAIYCGCEVADDGTVTAPKPTTPDADVPDESSDTAAGFQSTLKQNLVLAAAADIDLAKALAEAENTICQHATPANVQDAVAYVYGPVVHPVADPFLADVNVGSGPVPSPGDPNWQSYWQALTDLEKAQLIAKWNSIGKDFNPYTTIQGGALPPWATQFNQNSQNACSAGADGRPVGAGYGYFGGGTIMGPDGKPWPIVNPYYSDGTHVYLADGGAARTDGGINELDGHDPGWHTVESYIHNNTFGSVSTTTKIITAAEIGTGQDLETNPTDPSAVNIGPNGLPVVGDPGGEPPSPIADKPWWDAKPLEDEPHVQGAGAPPPPEPAPFNNGEAALAANVAVVQTGQAATGWNDVASHGDREWQVQYQVNDDGRVRAVVNTYTAGPNEDGGTNVGGFANAFPTGQHGNTSEIPIDVRDNPYTTPTAGPAVPGNVHYLGDPGRNGDLIDNQTPIQEQLNK